jgi:hypothetical protein
VSEIIENQEKIDVTELMCGNCIGSFQRVLINEPKLFSVKFFQRWFYQCNQCGLRTKSYCSKIKQETK